MRLYVSQYQFRSALSVHGERTAVSNALSLAETVVAHLKMNKLLLPLCYTAALFGCSSAPSYSDKSVQEASSQEKVAVSPKTPEVIADKSVKGKRDTVEVVWELDFDTAQTSSDIRIENDNYVVRTEVYCLNDSSIVSINDINNDAIYRDVYHDYQASIYLIREQDTTFSINLTKAAFKDSLSDEFFEASVLSSIEYESVRSNRLYFKVWLNVPDTDWMIESEMAVFYRTNKKGRVDYWGIKDVGP